MNQDSLQLLLRGLHLHGMHLHAQTLAITAEREGLTFLRYLHLLAEVEHQDRLERRTGRLRKLSRLPAGKTLATLQQERLSSVARRHLAVLCAGDFVAKAQNVLAFGLPGRGKTHVLCAIGHCLVDQGHTVLFIPTYQLVQRLLAAKANLRLDKELRKLDHFDAIICDDIGYVQQSRDEMEVLFTFLAERYERKSVLLSSNLVFSQWDRIFKDPMTTAAAIDRLVHHATILELTGASYRTEAAKEHTAAVATQPPASKRAGGQGEPTDEGSTGAGYRTEAATEHTAAVAARPPASKRAGGQGEPTDEGSTISTHQSDHAAAEPHPAESKEVHVNF